MEIDNYGRTILDSKEAFELLYSGKISTFENVFLKDSKEITKFNSSIKQNGDTFKPIPTYSKLEIPLTDFDKENQKQWFMPEEYCPNLIEFLYGCCTTPEQTNRVNQELELFIQHNMIELLHYLKYLVDTMRKNKIVWGVGRGSSVASYVLFLIGVHKIDSIKYNLDIKEFLK